MLYSALFPLAEEIGFFNLFRYITLRTGGATMTALVLTLIFGRSIIGWLKLQQGAGQPIREDGPKSHLVTKKGTPTMGGVLILFSILVSTLLWANLANHYVWIALLVTMSFGAIGFFDDYRKLSNRSSTGLSGRSKILGQVVIGVVAAFWMSSVTPGPLADELAVPFFKEVLVPLGWFFLPWAVLVMVGASNAVNLTDGLDGLAIMPVLIAAVCFAMIAYLAGNAVFSNYLQIHYVRGAGELAVFCGALVGAGLGFLWFNAPPAMVFMGDTGSLSTGGALGAVSLITKHELVLVIVGGLFVLETVSVIVQVVSFKLTGRRIFRMAPLHHHFEHKGWAESTIVIRFWIIAIVLALAGLSTLKLR